MSKKYSREWWQELRPERVGSEVEKLVEGIFKEWSRRQGFAWHRMPDAKAARGALKAQPADYLVANQTQTSFIEVKALKAARLLPKDRISQLATLKKFEETAMRNYVLVFQYLEGLWRIESVEHIEMGATSWDVTKWPTYGTAEDAMKSVGLSPF